MLRLACFSIALCAFAVPALPDEPVDLVAVTRIREEGLANSKVMDTLAYLTDVIGPRVTGSPQLKQANEWTRLQLQSWGLANAHLEAWGPFGRGWSLERTAVHMVAPAAAPLIALPRAWTPGTGGPRRAPVVKVHIETEADMEKYKGQLEGKIVLLSDPGSCRGRSSRCSPATPTATSRTWGATTSAPAAAPSTARPRGGASGRSGRCASSW